MAEMKFLKHGKGSGFVVTIKDACSPIMNQIVMNMDRFEIDKTPDDSLLTE